MAVSEANRQPREPRLGAKRALRRPRPDGLSGHRILIRLIGWLVLSAAVGVCLFGWWLDASLAGRDHGATPNGRSNSLGLRAETPVLFGNGGKLRSAPRPAPVIALTFSGGLDDEWIGQVEDVLAEHDVTATFFLTGQALIEHPKRVRQLEDAGHEIGVNGYSAVDLANLDDWQVRLHLSTTETLLASATGRWSRLFRPPGAQPLRGIDDADLDLARVAIDEGYTVVLADRVASIWSDRRSAEQLIGDVLPIPGTAAVVEFPTPPPARRRVTLDVLRFALDAIPAQAAAAQEPVDIEFVTVSQYAGRDADDLHPIADDGERWRGQVLARSLPILATARGGVHVLAVVLLVLGTIRMGLGTFVALRARRHPVTPPGLEAQALAITVLIAARDEAESIVATIEALFATTHPSVEIIVIDDGSTDGTADLVLAMRPGRPGIGLSLSRQEGIGKSSALNLGLLEASHEIVVCIDADTLVEPEALTLLAEPFLDPAVGAVSGHVLVGNPGRLLGRFQRAEYAVGCTIERRLLNRLGFMTCVSGAVGAYRRHALSGIGGFSSDTCAEDTDAALALQRAAWTARYAPDARAHTIVPLSIRGLWTQRVRWSLGVAQSVWKHRGGMTDSGRSGWLGRRALPYLIVFGGLSVLGPVVDAVAIFAILTARVDQLVLIWAALVGVTTALTALAFAIEGQPLRRAWIVPLQILIYRPFLYLAQLRALQIASVGLRPVWRRRRRVETMPAVATFAAPPVTDWLDGGFLLFAEQVCAEADTVIDLRRGSAEDRTEAPAEAPAEDRTADVGANQS